MWQMSRDIAQGHKLGDIGSSPEVVPQININTDCLQPYTLLGFIELYKKSGNDVFLQTAERIGHNILDSKSHKGFFVPSKNHTYTKFDSPESLVLLQLYAALYKNESPLLPQTWPCRPFFQGPYRLREATRDTELYALVDASELDISLEEAAKKADLVKMKELIAKGFHIDTRAKVFKRTALHFSSISGCQDIAEWLLDNGATVDAKDSFGRSPLYYASEQGHEEIVSLLIGKGADVNARDSSGNTPLHYAARSENVSEGIIELLVGRGADINAKNNNGQTPIDVAAGFFRRDTVTLFVANGAEISNIYVAAYVGDAAKVKAFIEKGADINAKDLSGDTPLHYAAKSESAGKDIVELLITNGADVNAKNNEGKTPLDIALQRKREDIARLLVEKGAVFSDIHNAVRAGNLEQVRAFLEEGVDVNAKGTLDYTPLHRAVAEGHKEIAELLISRGADVNARNKWDVTPLHFVGNNIAIAEILIAEGAELDAKNKFGYTPLHFALLDGYRDMVKFIVEKGADVNVLPDDDGTPLEYAVWRNDLEMVKLFVAHGGRFDLKDHDGWTALRYAAEQGNHDLVDFFVSKGAKVSDFHVAAFKGDISRIKKFTARGEDIESKDESLDWTPLYCAVAGGQIEAVEFLLDKGACADVKTANGSTPLHKAADNGSVGIVELLVSNSAEVDAKDINARTPMHLAVSEGHREVVEVLLSKGADINAKNKNLQTPLHLAARQGHRGAVELLLTNGADMNAKNKWGRTPLDIAVDRGHQEIVELLRKQFLVHDAAVTDISGQSSCKKGSSVPITVTVENQGNYSETIQVKLTDVTEGKHIETQSVTLAARCQSASDADVIFTGEAAATTQYGNHFEEITDINGDGYGDILMGGGSRWGSNRGRCYLYYGGPDMDAKPDKIFTGENTDDYFAEYIATGDVNNDRYSDVIVGAPGYESFQGRVYIFYGGPDMDEEPDKILDGEAGHAGWFGRVLVSGDINNDGYADLAITANHMHEQRGRVYLYYGGPDMDDIPDKSFDGENALDLFGKSLALGQDVNGDGHGDLLIGSWDYPGNLDRGRAYLYFGGPDMNEMPDKIFTGENNGDRFSNDSYLADVDNDGFADVIVGALSHENSRGRIYIFHGEADMDTNPDKILNGEAAPARASLGGAINCADINNDGYADILAGGYSYYATARTGRAYLYYGGSRTSMSDIAAHIFDGESPNNRFGNEVALGDVNGDGLAEVVVGAWGYNDAQGRAYLFYSPFENKKDIIFNWDTTNASIGKHTLKVQIQPVEDENDTADNVRMITIDVKAK
jgi:ankyrin repeat protein